MGCRDAEVDAEQAPGQVLDLLRGKRLHGDAPDLVPGEEVEDAGRDTRSVHRVERQQEQHALSVQPAHDEGEDAEALHVQLVHVVDGDNYAPVGLQTFEVGAEGRGVVHYLGGGESGDGRRLKGRAAVVILC